MIVADLHSLGYQLSSESPQLHMCCLFYPHGTRPAHGVGTACCRTGMHRRLSCSTIVAALTLVSLEASHVDMVLPLSMAGVTSAGDIRAVLLQERALQWST